MTARRLPLGHRQDVLLRLRSSRWSAASRVSRTTGGTVGVGRATTRAVVAASIAVLVSDFFLTQLWLAAVSDGRRRSRDRAARRREGVRRASGAARRRSRDPARRDLHDPGRLGQREVGVPEAHDRPAARRTAGRVCVLGEDITRARERELDPGAHGGLDDLPERRALRLAQRSSRTSPTRCASTGDWAEPRIARARARVPRGGRASRAASASCRRSSRAACASASASRAAIALEPRAILYDEPTTGLDPANQRRIGELIRALQQRLGVTSVVVTHELELCFAISDRVALLQDGRIARAGHRRGDARSEHPDVRAFLSGERDAARSPGARRARKGRWMDHRPRLSLIVGAFVLAALVRARDRDPVAVVAAGRVPPRYRLVALLRQRAGPDRRTRRSGSRARQVGRVESVELRARPERARRRCASCSRWTATCRSASAATRSRRSARSACSATATSRSRSGRRSADPLEDGGELRDASTRLNIEPRDRPRRTQALENVATLAEQPEPGGRGVRPGRPAAKRLAELGRRAGRRSSSRSRTGHGLLHSLIYDQYEGGGVGSIERSLVTLRGHPRRGRAGRGRAARADLRARSPSRTSCSRRSRPARA